MKPLRPWGEAEESDFRERAAILEYEAGMSRAEAEHTARWMVVRSSGATPPIPTAAKPPASPERSSA